MHGNYVAVTGWFIKEYRCALRDIQMGSPVETVTPHTVFFVPVIGKRIEIGMFRHGLVEGSIEYRYVGDLWQQRLGCLDAGNIGRVVQRSKMLNLFNRIQYLLVDHY